jgi:hypothetical protein
VHGLDRGNGRYAPDGNTYVRDGNRTHRSTAATAGTFPNVPEGNPALR